MCNEVSPSSVMVFLNDLFTEFDSLVEEHGVYKVEVCCLPVLCLAHGVAVFSMFACCLPASAALLAHMYDLFVPHCIPPLTRYCAVLPA
jgi:hypothetical protein